MDWSTALAVAGQATADTAATAEKQSSPFGIVPVIIIMMVLFYVLIILPQKKGQKQVDTMRNSIESGDRVKSIGGIYGTVTAVNTTDNIITVQVDKNVKIDFDRNAIATVIKK